MSDTRFSEIEVESLLTRTSPGSAELEGLQEFIAALASEATQPRDTYHMGTTLAAISRATAPTARRGMRRLATLAATGAIFVALSGVALAADGSTPGDPLYRLDRALEAIGIGDGGFEERVQEFNVLLDRGEELEAYEFMAEVIAEAGDTGAAPQQDVGPVNDSPAPATGNRTDGEVPGENRPGNNRPEAPGEGNSRAPGNGNVPFNPGQDNPGQDNPGQDNPGQDNPGQDSPGQGNENPGSGNQGNVPDQPDANPDGSAGQGQPGSSPPSSPGQGNTGQGSPNQSSG